MKIIKKFFKKISKHERFRTLMCWLMADYVRFVYRYTKWDTKGLENIKKYWDEGSPVLPACWHGRMMMMHFGWQSSGDLYALVSQHSDGQLIANVLREFEVKIIEGSTSRGGAKAARKIIKILKTGGSVAITPDGPRGPRMRMGDSLLYFARMCQVPIIPVGFSAKRALEFKSWDKFLFMLPFSKGVFIIGEPVFVPKGADEEAIEQLRIKVEDSLNDLTRQADELMGRKPVEPADYFVMSGNKNFEENPNDTKILKNKDIKKKDDS